MFDPAQVTLGQVSSTIRDLAIIVAVLKVAWSARGMYGEAMDFIKRLKRFMVRMEKNTKATNAKLDLLLSNHLPHLQAELSKMSSGCLEEVVTETQSEKEAGESYYASGIESARHRDGDS